MKKILILLIIMIVFAACNIAQNAYSDRLISTMYKIKKIKNEKSFYTVYAMRNDSVFKIISFIDTTFIPNCGKIKVGGSYVLDLKKIFPSDSLFGKPLVPNLGIRSYKITEEKSVMIESKSHNKIYTALNLNGLCITY